ncbi:MAG: anaerobic C4-dicarboxylate transporter [Planctomycetota bacterium]|nr:anaerobic C4-dicarboxylate transporter [Planctomycetota bacterium]
MFWIEFGIVLACIFFGARIGGIALGTIAGLGLAILVFGFRQPAGAMPVDVILIIIAVVTAVSALQAAGGLDWMVQVAERILRAKPAAITFVAPAVSWLFTLFAGTGHVAYALLPVIAETSRQAGVRPERPMSISVIASQQSITASPISAATAGMVALFAVNGVDLGLVQILMVCVPATFLGSMIGAISVAGMGKRLENDPIYQDRLAKGLIEQRDPEKPQEIRKGARLSVAIFLAAAVGVVFLGILSGTRPVTGWSATAALGSVRLVEDDPYAFTVDLETNEITWQVVDANLSNKRGWIEIDGLSENVGVLQLQSEADSDRLLAGDASGLNERIASGELEVREPSATRVGMAPTIEIVMLAAAGLIMLFCRAPSSAIVSGSVARAGVVAVVSIMGIAWLGSTFFANNSETVIGALADTVQRMPWTFSIALFALSILLCSQAATVAALMGVGLQLGIEPKYLIAMFPAVNGYFFLPTYATILAAIQFDQTGTTRIGKYVLNHSFMIPGLVATISSVAIGFGLVAILL